VTVYVAALSTSTPVLMSTAVLKITNQSVIYLFRNLVKPSEMPRPFALTDITAHTQKHFRPTSSDKTQKKKKKKYIYIYL